MSQFLRYSTSGFRHILMWMVLVMLCHTMVSAQDISVDVSGDITDWMLESGQDNTDSSLSLAVISDTNPWYVKVRDALNNEKPEATAGHMTEWYDSSYVSSPQILTNSMKVTASEGSGYEAEDTVILSNADQRIVAGSATGSTVTIPIMITQPVTFSDVNLTAGHRYRIIVTFSGSFT